MELAPDASSIAVAAARPSAIVAAYPPAGAVRAVAIPTPGTDAMHATRSVAAMTAPMVRRGRRRDGPVGMDAASGERPPTRRACAPGGASAESRSAPPRGPALMVDPRARHPESGTVTRSIDPEALLADLNPEQREAATAFGAPLAILAGAGTGKTRTLTHRVAYGAATGALDPARTLVVTFTRDAAAEMRARLAELGVRRANAATFHAAALAQLRHFWPQVHGEPVPAVLESAYGLVARAAKPVLTGAERYTPTRDLVAEIEWAKVRRVAPDAYAAAAAAEGRECPIDPGRFERVFSAYEKRKAAEGRLDFADLLARLVDLLEAEDRLRAQVRERYAHFSVDEYQDTSPLQDALLSLWLDGRRDLAVVGDPEQTIYAFAGASPSFLTGFRRRFRGARVVVLRRNYRSSPEVLALANRLGGAPGSGGGGLVATEPAGPAPRFVDAADGDAELEALVGEARRLATAGVPYPEMAVLVRLNAALVPIEAVLARAGVPYRLRGDAFFARADVRRVADDLRAAAARQPAEPAEVSLRRILAGRFGYDPEAPVIGDEAVGRAAAADTLLAIAAGTPTVADLVAEIERRAAEEEAGTVEGVNLLTDPPGEGPRMGGCPAARLGGDDTADPPGPRQPGRDRRGAPPRVRRGHAGAPPPLALGRRPPARAERERGEPPTLALPRGRGPHRRRAPTPREAEGGATVCSRAVGRGGGRHPTRRRAAPRRPAGLAPGAGEGRRRAALRHRPQRDARRDRRRPPGLGGHPAAGPRDGREASRSLWRRDPRARRADPARLTEARARTLAGTRTVVRRSGRRGRGCEGRPEAQRLQGGGCPPQRSLGCLPRAGRRRRDDAPRDRRSGCGGGVVPPTEGRHGAARLAHDGCRRPEGLEAARARPGHRGRLCRRRRTGTHAPGDAAEVRAHRPAGAPGRRIHRARHPRRRPARPGMGGSGRVARRGCGLPAGRPPARREGEGSSGAHRVRDTGGRVDRAGARRGAGAGTPWEVEPGDHGYVALAVWWPDEALLKVCRDFSDLEIGPDGHLYLLSDRSDSIARLSDLPPSGGTVTAVATWRLGDLGGKPEGLAFTPNGRALVALDTRKARHNLLLFEPPIAAG